MSSTKDQDAVPYQNAPLTSADAGVAGERRMAGDSRRTVGARGTPMSYLGPDGNPLAVTGDQEAPFFKIIFDVPALTPVSSIPSDAENLGDGVLVASQIASSLHDGWVTDSREDTTDPRWILLFDDDVAPTAGDAPSYAPIALCRTTSIEYDMAPWGFTRGIVIAISSTANVYTAITPANDYAITVRVQPRSL